MQYLMEWGKLFLDQSLCENLQNSSLCMWVGEGYVVGGVVLLNQVESILSLFWRSPKAIDRFTENKVKNLVGGN